MCAIGRGIKLKRERKKEKNKRKQDYLRLIDLSQQLEDKVTKTQINE